MSRGRKRADWNGDPAVCAYCLGANDRRHHKNHNGTPATRCAICSRALVPEPVVMDDAERARIAAMLERPTWRTT